MIRLNKILIPTDLSDYAQHTLPYGVELSLAFGAKLDLIHILQPQWSSSIGITEFPGALETSIEIAKHEAATALRNLRESLENPDVVNTHLLQGIAHVEIVRYARQQEIDLIILATHGRTGLSHALIGSVAEKVVQMAPCPVLTIKHPEHEFVLP